MSATQPPPLPPRAGAYQSALFEDGAYVSATPSAMADIPSYLASPKSRGPFMRIDAANKATPFSPRHREFTIYTSNGPVFEPAYEGRRYLINTQTRDVYSRTGAKLVRFENNVNHEAILDKLCQPFGSKEPHWLEVVYPCMKVAIGDELKSTHYFFLHAAVVLDLLEDRVTAAGRRMILQEQFDVLGIRQRPVAGSVHLVSQFPLHMSCSLAAAVALQNREFHGRLFSGIISKSTLAFYPFQKESPVQTSYVREFFNINNLDGYHEV